MTSPDNSPSEGLGVTIECPIRWGDMDALGHVNNTVYFRFCESARIAYFEAIDLDRFKEGPKDGPGLVAANLNFRKQTHYPDTIRVSANTSRIGGKSFTLHYILRSANGETVADGDSVCVWVDYAQGKAKPLPAALIDRIEAIEGGSVGSNA
ncbi:MAG: acyl-CoA thioesterase [Planctomycetota bacterium]|jgi:acyl-CoA thioester hydrolase